MVGGSPEEIGIAENEGGLAVLLPAVVWKTLVTILGRIRPENALLRDQEIQDELRVQGPVTWIIEDENSIDLERWAGTTRIDGRWERTCN